MEFNYDNIKRIVLRKYAHFGSILSGADIVFCDDKTPVSDSQGNSGKIPTAATDGKKLFFNTDFMNTLTETEQAAIMAHELAHIGLQHIERRKDKDGALWNIATDAIINKQLEIDGLKLPKDCVRMDDALEYNAEELYQKLLERKQQQQDKQNSGQGKQSQEPTGSQSGSQGAGGNSGAQRPNSGQGNGSQQNNSDKNDGDNKEEKSIDDLLDQGAPNNHSLWDQTPNKDKNQGETNENGSKDNKPETKKDEQKQDKSDKSNKDKSPDENKYFDQMRQERAERAKQAMDKIREACGKGNEAGKDFDLHGIGTAKSVVNWKKKLVKMLDLEDEAWGHRYSDAETGWRARIEDVEIDDDAETEIIVDTSGSVDDALLRSFLQQAKNILKDSKIKVGMFSNEFYGWQEINHTEDIDQLEFKGRGGTNFNAASKAFSKRKDINRICFTDGEDGGDAGIVDKRKDILWVSFRNAEFKPDNGKVLYVTPEQIKDDNGRTR